MMRLTVHIENAPFETRKPKKAKCIMNTLTMRNLKSMDEVNKKLIYIKDNYKVAKWKSGRKQGKEMIYIANQ
jgi:hypothetical protein